MTRDRDQTWSRSKASERPKLATFSLNVPITVNWMPWTFSIWPTLALWLAVEPLGQFLGEQRHLLPQRDVAPVQEAAGEQDQVPDRGIVFVRADDLDVLLAAADQHPVELGHHAGGGHDALAKLLPHGLDVGELDEVGLHLDPAAGRPSRSRRRPCWSRCRGSAPG